MLPRLQRLSSKQLDLVIKNGIVIHSKLFWIKFIKNSETTRFAVLSPVKIAKKAVDRNKIRRIIYSIISSFGNDLIEGYHVIVCPKESIIDIKDSNLVEQIKSVFVKIGLLK